MRKISKSDILDKGQEARDREFLDAGKASQHFKKGTFIQMAHRGRGEILNVVRCKCSCGKYGLLVRWEDNTTEIIEPFALNRNSGGVDA